jgi:hypothetical protein
MSARFPHFLLVSEGVKLAISKIGAAAQENQAQTRQRIF